MSARDVFPRKPQSSLKKPVIFSLSSSRLFKVCGLLGRSPGKGKPMNYSLLIFAIFVSLFSTSSEATIYIVAYDEATGAIGTAVSSSGPPYFNNNRWHVEEKGLGMVSAGGGGFCSKATPAKFLKQGLTAKEIALKIAEQCDDYKPYYRLAVVTSKGDVYVHEGPEGCNEWNEQCATMQGEKYGVTGGGLEDGVVLATFEHFKTLDKKIPLECRLFDTIKKAFDAGGETIDFKVTGITVSYPNKRSTESWQVSGSEWKLLSKLQDKMSKGGVSCASWEY
jgi:uncharacterized Ntn-hydrolase superfamily protein